MQTQTLHIFQYERVVYGDAPEHWAAVHLCAVGAGVQSALPDAVAIRASHFSQSSPQQPISL